MEVPEEGVLQTACQRPFLWHVERTIASVTGRAGSTAGGTLSADARADRRVRYTHTRRLPLARAEKQSRVSCAADQIAKAMFER